MKTFRGEEVEGWEIVTESNEEAFQLVINNYMDEFDFQDFQFSTCVKDGRIYYTAAILLKAKV